MPNHSPLSPREMQVAELLSRGMTDGEIAAALCIKWSTVRTHVRHVLLKANVSRRRELMGRFGRGEGQ